MQEARSTDTQSQVPSTGTETGQGPAGQPGQGPSGDLQQQIQALDSEIKKIQDGIAGEQGKLRAAEAELEKQRAKQKALEATRTGLKSVVASANGDRQKVAQQREAADQEGQAAYEELKQIQHDLEDQLADDYTGKVNQAIQHVDEQIKKYEDDVKARQQELSEAMAALAAKQDASAKAQADLRQAQAALRGLPAQIQAALAQVKKTRAALQTAYTRGPAREAYLLAIESNGALTTLGKLRDPKYEQALADRVQEAWSAYSNAGAGIPTSEDQVKTLKDDLTSRTKKLQEYRDNRRKHIEELLAAEQPEQEGGKQTPTEQKGGTEAPPAQATETAETAEAPAAAAFTPATQY